jgi:hypothetical protein
MFCSLLTPIVLCFPDPPEYVGSYVLNVSELWPIGTPFGTLSIFEPVMKLHVRGVETTFLGFYYNIVREKNRR